MLNIHKASIFFQGEPLFSDITFRLGNGNRVGLIGKNGAWVPKSTLLYSPCFIPFARWAHKLSHKV